MQRRDGGADRVIWRRFRADGDCYVRLRQGALFVARVAAVAERAVDLAHSLAGELDPLVDVRIDDQRRGLVWGARELPRADVRDALTRLKLPLATYGGAELSLITPTDQLTVTADLLLFAVGRTDRWWRALDRFGLRAQRRILEPQWMPAPGPPRPVRDLSDAIDVAVQQLELQRESARGADGSRGVASGEGPRVVSSA
jgi:hypothetical protein